jgi:cellulose biosynthesis protein BcsQ
LSRVISIVNSRNGVGKKTITTNLANELGISKRVLILDFDPLGKLSDDFKVSKSFSIKNILERSSDFPDVVQKSSKKNIFVLPSNIDILEIEESEINYEKLSEIIKYLKTKFDYLIIYTAENSFFKRVAIENSSKILIPVKVENMALYFIKKELAFLKNIDKNVWIIPNMYEDNLIDIYREIIKTHEKNLLKNGRTSLKIDFDSDNSIYQKILKELQI